MARIFRKDKDIFTIIKFIEKLDSDYNQKRIDGGKFNALQYAALFDLEDAVKDIGIDNVIGKRYWWYEWHFNESPFEFIVSKMFNKVKEKEEAPALRKAFQYLAKEIVDKKGEVIFVDLLDKAIGTKKNTISSKGVNQKDFIRDEFHKLDPNKTSFEETLEKAKKAIYASDHKGFGKVFEPFFDKYKDSKTMKDFRTQLYSQVPGDLYDKVVGQFIDEKMQVGLSMILGKGAHESSEHN